MLEPSVGDVLCGMGLVHRGVGMSAACTGAPCMMFVTAEGKNTRLPSHVFRAASDNYIVFCFAQHRKNTTRSVFCILRVCTSVHPSRVRVCVCVCRGSAHDAGAFGLPRSLAARCASPPSIFFGGVVA